MPFLDEGSVDQSVYFRLRDAATGLGKTGLTHASAGMAASYTVPQGLAVDITPTSTLAAADDAHADLAIKEVSATLAPGLYRLDVPDAVVEAPAGRSVVVALFADDVINDPLEVQIIPRKYQAVITYIRNEGGAEDVIQIAPYLHSEPMTPADVGNLITPTITLYNESGTKLIDDVTLVGKQIGGEPIFVYVATAAERLPAGEGGIVELHHGGLDVGEPAFVWAEPVGRDTTA